jgi:hypothetical protein
MDETVITQLWDDDPPEVWQAAQRLRAAGMQRLDIIHQIASALADLAPERVRRGKVKAVAPTGTVAEDAVLQIKVTLRWSKPPIWRRLRLPAHTMLAGLHRVLQVAFGWQDSHLHAFQADGGRYAPREFDLDRASPSEGVQLHSVLGGVGAKLRYAYDFGDGWEHEVLVEKVAGPDGMGYAECLAGRRSGPVEDCGGIGGWEYLCEVLADPNHPEREERIEWLGYEPDPSYLDLDAVNRALARVPLRG